MRKRKALAVLALVGLMAGQAQAGGGGMTGGATEVTQLMNNVELAMATAQQVRMVANQLTQLANEAKNLTSAPQSIWGQAQAELQQLAGLVRTGQSLSYAAQNIDSLFRERFPGYSSQGGQNYSTQYQSWSRTSLDSISAALSSAGLQANQFATERQAIETIQGISAGSPGALQAIQAGNMIASQQVDQMQKLRQLMMSQQQAQSAYMSYQVQKDSQQQGAADRHFQLYTPAGGGWSSRGGKR